MKTTTVEGMLLQVVRFWDLARYGSSLCIFPASVVVLLFSTCLCNTIRSNGQRLRSRYFNKTIWPTKVPRNEKF
ncbi:unnamed protein product [Meloidogyne enterolobii]|uniref:Uncharacterized protein n=1 Tax=Meloidogyne enterolobii TaxID=390850 RepID=A0ACB0ZWC2_MELEN